MQSHGGHIHQGMGWPPISWTHVFQTSSQEVLQMEPITDEVKENNLRNKRRSNIMRVWNTILAAEAESGIDLKIGFSTINQLAMPSSMENIC